MKEEKLEYLDGMRGLMAINVLLCHFVCVYYPQMYFFEFSETMGGWLRYFAVTPLSVLVNGNIAVQYFFVLTGFLVGRTFFVKSVGAEDIVPRAIRRYLRLLPVVAVTSCIVFFTMRFDLQWHLKIADMVPNKAFLEDYCNFTERIIHLIPDIFVRCFMESSAYVGPFWTIKYEFWGYILSMLICLVMRNRKTRRMEYLILMVIFLDKMDVRYLAFILGILVADLQFNKKDSVFGQTTDRWLKKKGVIYLLLVAGIYLSSCPLYYTFVHSLFAYIPYIETGTVRAVGIALVIYAILNLPLFQRLLSHKLLLFLGKLSFEVYAIHWPLMLSFQAWVFSKMIRALPYDASALLSFVITIPLIYLSAYIMNKGICLAGQIQNVRKVRNI